MRRLLVLGGILAIGAAPAQGAASGVPALCPALKRIIAAAAETPSFGSVADARGHGAVLIGELTDCNALVGVTFGDRYICQTKELSPEAAAAAVLALQPQISSCLGLAGTPGVASKNEIRFTVSAAPRTTVVALTGNDGKVAVISVSIYK